MSVNDGMGIGGGACFMLVFGDGSRRRVAVMFIRRCRVRRRRRMDSSVSLIVLLFVE